MSSRQRNIFMSGLFVAIALGLFFFGRFLSSDDLNAEQQPIRIRTITAIVGANQTTEAQLHQTETADIHERFCQTLTPEPKTMTAIVGITKTYEIGYMMTQAVLSGMTFVPTPTINIVQPTITTGTLTPVPSSTDE